MGLRGRRTLDISSLPPRGVAMRRLGFCFGLLSTVLVFSIDATAFFNSNCDKNSDQRLTASDALLELREAVAPHCPGYSPCPDMNADGSMTATDALLLLRLAVGADLQSDCQCIAVDECFSNADCQGSGYPPGFYCAGYSCVECESASQCLSGVCDVCGLCSGTTTTTTLSTPTITVVASDCFMDYDCEGSILGNYCCGHGCCECRLNEHCPQGQICSADKCGPPPTTTTVVVVTTTSATTTNTGDQCLVDDDCEAIVGPGWQCGGPNGYTCVECEINPDCQPGYVCDYFQCVPSGQ